MGIMGYISQQRARFRDAQFKRKESLARAEADRLRMERERQAKLAQAQAEKVRLERDVASIRGFTEKHQTPSNVQKFGAGLAKVMNKTRSGVKQLKSGSPGGGLQLGTPSSQGSMGINTQHQGMQVGVRDVFSIGPQKKEMPKPKPKRVIVEL